MSAHIIQYAKLPEDLQNRLQDFGEVHRVDSLEISAGSELVSLLAVADGLIGVNQKVGPELLDLAPELKVVSTISVGYDYFDVADLTRRGIMLMHTPDVLTETTADMVFTLILCAARRATELNEMVRRGAWSGAIGPEAFGSDVHGKKLGILGPGRIGSAVARRGFAGFNMEILYCGRSAKPQLEAECAAHRCSLEELLAEADFVCVILPLTDATHKLIGPSELALMKPEAFLINGGRGPVVDQDALIKALRSGTIRGAGLDVYEKEPLPADSPLLKLSNVVTLPHIGSATHETRYQMARLAVDNLLGALKDRSPVNCVNPEVTS